MLKAIARWFRCLVHGHEWRCRSTRYHGVSWRECEHCGSVRDIII